MTEDKGMEKGQYDRHQDKKPSEKKPFVDPVLERQDTLSVVVGTIIFLQ